LEDVLENTVVPAWPPTLKALCRHENVSFHELFEIMKNEHFTMLVAIGNKATSRLNYGEPETLKQEHTEFVSQMRECLYTRDNPISDGEDETLSNLCALVLQASANPLTWKDLTKQESAILSPAATQDLVNRDSPVAPQDPNVPAADNPLPNDVNFVVHWVRGKGELPTWHKS